MTYYPIDVRSAHGLAYPGFGRRTYAIEAVFDDGTELYDELEAATWRTALDAFERKHGSDVNVVSVEPAL